MRAPSLNCAKLAGIFGTLRQQHTMKRRLVQFVFLLLLFLSGCTCRRKQLKPKNAIEDVDTNRLEELVKNEEFIAAFFYSKICRTCDKILQELEKINDDAENFGVQFVKNADRAVAEKYGASKLPSLVYFRNKEPIVFDGDLMNEDMVLAWLTDIESMELPDAIEEVNAKLLQNLIDETEFVAVIFYKSNSTESESVLRDLEEIDDKADQNGIAFVKTGDESLAMEFGLESIPALLYYRNKVPLLYDGNLHEARNVLKWLVKHKDPEADEIEEITAKILTSLIENSTYLAVLFYDKNNETSEIILSELEAVDDDAKKNGIPFVKIDDSKIASDFGIDELPALIYFESRIPNFYTGNLSNGEVLQWLIHQKNTDEIEDVTYHVLQLMIKTSDFLAVLFYDSKSPTSQSVLHELETIDDNCDKYGIPFVKIDDDQLEAVYGIKNPPTLGFYNKQILKFYEGDLKNKENVLNWLIEQMQMEEIEDVSKQVLEQMIKTMDYLSVLFYDKNSEKSLNIIKELENIDDEASERNLPFVKISDPELSKSFGFHDLPVLVYFEKQIPSVFQGDLSNEEAVLDYMMKQMSSDEIEEVTEKLLGILIAKHDVIAVLFYDPSSSNNEHVFQQLENIDQEADKQGIVFLKTSDIAAAEKYGLEYLPALVFFYQKMPNVYHGDLSKASQVLEWFTNQLTKDEVEDVTEKMLLNLIKTTPALAVLFYDDSEASIAVQKEMEKIDDDTGAIGIPFVKINDESLARQCGFTNELPILVYYENRLPSVYGGNLKNSQDVLEWLTKQKNEDSIEEVTEELLKTLMRDNSYILTFFIPEECAYCEEILQQLESIDDDMDNHGILLLSTRDVDMALKTPNVTELPALVMYRNGDPVVYEGEIMDIKSILKWSTSEETLDLPGAIEEVNSKMLEKLLTESHSLAVLFYQKTGCSQCEKVLQDLENIDEEAEKNEIDFVKVSDPEIARIYEVDTFPSLIFFRRQEFEFYSGDLSDEAAVLSWLVENRDRPDSFIEYISRRDLEIMLEGPTIAVFFYEENCTICDSILTELENIDDDADRYGVQIVKTDDGQFANELGVSVLPSLVYFENMIPSIYDGDLTNEDEILRWLVQQKTEDTIENINRDMLFRMIEEQDYLAIYFYKEHDKESKEILKHLEQIDDDCSDYEVTLLKMSDNLMAKKYKVRNPPGLVFFRHGVPIKYSGDLTDEEDVLEFLTSPENMESSDSIEKVNRRMLERVLTRSDFLAVFFYKKAHCRRCEKALEELEKIDDDAEDLGIQFVKIEDPKLARSTGVFSVPSIVFFRYGNTDDPVVFAGDVRNGAEILCWLISQKDPGSDMIEEMDGDELEELIESADFLAVLFYDPDEEDCPECQTTLNDLENIDDDTDRHSILFVKTTDDSIASDYGITKFPALIYFENNVPSIYEGDISAEEEVLQWLIHSKSEDTIETVNRDMCEKLIENTPFLVVVFYKQQTKASDEALDHLEAIDGITDEYGIQMVKTQDGSLGRRYGVTGFPAVVYFRNTYPLVYKGDITDEQGVLDWLLSDGTMLLPDNIEEVNTKMLDKLISKFQLLAVYFYEKECDECIENLKSLEDIDEEADLFGIGFVKISDVAAAVEWNVQEIPALAYFRKKIPVFYEGSLSDAEGLLDWLTSQDMIEFKNEIEEVSRKMFDKLLIENDFFAVYFYDDDCPLCEEALKQLELIDDEIEELDIVFVKIKDAKYARRYGVKNLPALAYFRKRFPTQFRGDIMNPEETLNWLKNSRYRKRELNLFMFSMIAMGAAFIQYTLFLKFCFEPMVENKS